MNAPRLMLSHRGKRKAKSLEVAIELVEMFVPSVARPLMLVSSVDAQSPGPIAYNAAEQKKAAALLSHRLMIWVGSQ